MQVLNYIVLSGVVLLAGCGDRGIFEISSSSGGTYILNRYTGTTYRVEGTEKIELSQAISPSEKKPEIKTFSIDKLGNVPMSLSLRTQYVDNKIRFSVTAIEAINPKLVGSPSGGVTLAKVMDENRQFGTINLLLRDNQGFQVANIPLNILGFTHLTGDDGKTSWYKFDGEVSMPYKAYNEIADMGATWRLVIPSSN